MHHDDIALSLSLTQPIGTLVAVVAWVVVFVSAFALRLRTPIFAFAIGWFLIAHALESTVIPLEMVYEHRNYLAGFSLCLFVSYMLVYVSCIWSARLTRGIGVGILVTLWVLLVMRTSHWRNELDLTEHHLANHPQSGRTIYHYANARWRRAEVVVDEDRRKDLVLESRAAYALMQAQDPSNVVALVALLWLDSEYFAGVETERWLTELEQSLQTRLLVASDYNALPLLTACANTSWCQLGSERYIHIMENLYRRFPADSFPLTLLASHYREGLGEYDLAAATCRRAIAVNPRDRRGYRELIASLTAAGQTGKALEVVRRLQLESTSLHELNELNAMFVSRLTH